MVLRTRLGETALALLYQLVDELVTEVVDDFASTDLSVRRP
jgi:hypothetical protein